MICKNLCHQKRIEEILELKTIIREAKIKEDNDLQKILFRSSSTDRNFKEFNPIMAEMKALKEIKEQEQSEENKTIFYSENKNNWRPKIKLRAKIGAKAEIREKIGGNENRSEQQARFKGKITKK